MFALPAVVIAASLAWTVVALWRSARGVRTLLRSSVVGPGPGESVVVADGALLVAVAGLRRPQVVVSAGALLALDDEELRAGLEHERGHIALRHRYLLVAGELARAVARLMPGTAAAARELLFSLERHADAYAVARRHDPAALASAICKTAPAQFAAPPALALGGGVVARRARLLLEAGARVAEPRTPLGLVALVPVMVALVAASAIALPFVAHAGYHEKHRSAAVQSCVNGVTRPSPGCQMRLLRCGRLGWGGRICTSGARPGYGLVRGWRPRRALLSEGHSGPRRPCPGRERVVW